MPPPPIKVLPAGPEATKKGRVITIIKRSILLLLAILLAVSLFSPFLNAKVETADILMNGIDKKVTLSLNPIDNIKLFISSLSKLNSADLMDEYYDLQDKYEDEYTYWNKGRKLDSVNDFFKDYLNITYKSEDVNSGVLIVPALLSVISIIMVIVLLVLAITTFISTWSRNIQSNDSSSLMLVGMSAIFILASAIAIKFTFMPSQSITCDWKLSSFQIFVYIAIVVATIIIIILNAIIRPLKIKSSEIIKRSIGVVLAIVVVITSFMPILNIDTRAVFSGESRERTATQAVDPVIFVGIDSCVSTESSREFLEKYHNTAEMHAQCETMFDSLSYYSKRQIENGDASLVNYALTSYLLLGFGALPFAQLISYAGFIAPIAAIICSLIFIWINIFELAERKKNHGASKILSRIFAMLMSMVLLGWVMAIMLIVNNNAVNTEIDYSISMAAGPIIMVFSSVVLAFVPSVKKREYYE